MTSELGGGVRPSPRACLQGVSPPETPVLSLPVGPPAAQTEDVSEPFDNPRRGPSPSPYRGAEATGRVVLPWVSSEGLKKYC